MLGNSASRYTALGMIDDVTRQIPLPSRRGPGGDRRVRTRSRIPALTILYHPDCRRVGERVLLNELASGKQVALSRSELGFAAPGENRFRALEDPYLSRRPVVLRHDAKTAQIVVESTGTPTALMINGTLVEGERRLPAEDLERGAVFELGQRIVLILNLMSAAPVDSRSTPELIGDSDGINRVRNEIETVAGLDLPVLLRGETGTGKELVARAIHQASKRHDQTFLGLNMGAITPSLAVSELFGAVKGAFTGAVRSQPGYFQRAHHGTLFLDEIGATPSEVQVMLLRVLETGEVQRVGTQETQVIDVRLISATDANLEEAIDSGRFRGPLLHRLAGYEIRIPPLRDRRDDIGRLLFHFLRRELRTIGEEHCLDFDSPEEPQWLAPSIAARLARYDWPGNVRQLQNVARQLVVASRGSETARVSGPVERVLRAVDAPSTTVANASHLDSDVTPAQGSPTPRFRKPSEVSEEELLQALRANRWELKPTAANLRISRGSLYNLIAKSPRLRKTSDVSESEILECYERCSGNLDQMVDQLEISRSGLQMRMKALDIG